MQGIEFETDKSYTPSSYAQQGAPAQQTPTMVRWLMRIGVVDISSANYILLGIAGLFLGVTIFLYAGALSEPAKDWSLDARASLEAQKLQR